MLSHSKELLDETNQFNARLMRGLRWHFTLKEEDFEK